MSITQFPASFFCVSRSQMVLRGFIMMLLMTLGISSSVYAKIEANQVIHVLKTWFSPSTTVVDVEAASDCRKITINGGVVAKPVTILVSETGGYYEGTIPGGVKLDAILGLSDVPLLKNFGARNLKFIMPAVSGKDSAIFEGEFTFAGKNLYCRGLAIVSPDKKEAILFTRAPADHAKLSDLWGDLKGLIIPLGELPLPPGMVILSSTAIKTKIKDLPELTHSFFKEGGEVLDFEQPIVVTQPGLSAMCRFDPADIHPILKKIRGAMGVGPGSTWFSIEVGIEGLVIAGHLPPGTNPTWVPSILKPHWTDGSRCEMIFRISTQIEYIDRTTMNITIAGSPLDLTLDCIGRFSGAGVGIEIKGDVAGMWHNVLGLKGLDLGNGMLSGGINTWLAEGNLVAGMAGAIGIKGKTYDMGIKATFEICPEAAMYGMPRAVTFRYECDRIGIGSLVDILEVFMKGFIAHPIYEKLNKLEMDAMVSASGGSEKDKKELEGIVASAYSWMRSNHSLTDVLGLNNLPAFELRDVLVFIDLPRIPLPGKKDADDTDTPANTSASRSFFKNSKDKLGKAGGLLAKTRTLGTGAALAGTLVLFDRVLGTIDFEFTIIGGIKIFGEIKPVDLGVINIRNCKVDIGCGFKCLPHFTVKGDVTFFGGERKVDVEFSKDRIYFEDLVDLAELWKTRLKMEVVKKHDGIIQPTNIADVKVHGEMHEDAQDWFKHQITDRLASSCKSLSDHIEEVRTTIPGLKKNVAELSDKVDELRHKFKGTLAKIESAIQAAKERIDALQKQIDQAQRDFDGTSKWSFEKRAYYKGKKYTLIALKETADKALDLLKNTNKDVLIPFEQWSEAIPVLGAFHDTENALDYAEHTISIGEKTLDKTREFIRSIGEKVLSVPFKIDTITFDARFPKTDSPNSATLKVKVNFGEHRYDGTATIIPLLACVKRETGAVKKQLSDNARTLADMASSIATGIFATINNEVKTDYIRVNTPKGNAFNPKSVIRKLRQINALQAQQDLFVQEMTSMNWK